jgi:DNA polymerase I
LLRDKNGKRTKRLFPYLPYFFVREEHLSSLKKYIDTIETGAIVNTEYGFRGVDGSKLVKVTVEDLYIISQLNNIIRSSNNPILLYESNIYFHYRFLIDKHLITGISDSFEPVEVESRHKKIFIDIEVLSDKEPKNYYYPIIVIGIYDSCKAQYHIIYSGKSFPINLEVLKTEPRNVTIYPCKDEEELISTFAKVWLDLEPDVVVSFSPFDMEYIVKRMNFLGISSSFLSPVYNIAWRRNLHVHGIHIIDYAELYRKVFGEPVWDTLDYISKNELGYGKLEISSVSQEWKNDFRKVVEYNLRDVELLKDLEDEIGLIQNFLLLIWSVTGLDLSDCLIPNRIGDILHFRQVKGQYRFLNESQISGEKYSGAIVICEYPGLHENVAVLDWSELYPSIMEDFHISFDTYDPFGDIKITRTIGFTSSKKGCTVELMKPFRDRRKQIKDQIKKTSNKKERDRLKLLSAAIKSIINAEYGLYGQKTRNFSSRFYDPNIAGAITLIGRETLLQAKNIIHEIGYILLYGDTDSLFVQLKTNDPQEILDIKDKIETSIKSYILNKYNVQSSLRLDLECVFKKVLILTKKRYDGITTSGERIIKGLNIIRKDTARITVEEQKKVGELRLSGEKMSNIKKYIKDLYDKVKRGKVTLEDISVKGRCSKEHYSRANRNWKAVEYSKKRNIEIEPGERFYWVYVCPKESILLKFPDGKSKEYEANVIAFKDPLDFPKDLYIDYKKMADFTIIQPLKRYIEENINKERPLSDYW